MIKGKRSRIEIIRQCFQNWVWFQGEVLIREKLVYTSPLNVSNPYIKAGQFQYSTTARDD